MIGKGTDQGAGAESTWARGQGWALYGFSQTYRWTRDPARLANAMAVADYFVAHLPADFVPYWDFEAPGIPDEPHESSADGAPTPPPAEARHGPEADAATRQDTPSGVEHWGQTP